MPRIRYEDRFDTYHVDDDNNTRRQRIKRDAQRPPTERAPGRKQRMADGRESFKCGQCKAFIGPTVSGGRHRNHCPLCLYSRHVDDRQPGDRASCCRSLMKPIGTFHRRKGEQVLLHLCLGCGVERYNRVAADDNLIACLRLPLVAPRGGETTHLQDGEDLEEAIA